MAEKKTGAAGARKGARGAAPVAVHSARLALEPRLVFDAAALATGIDVVDAARDAAHDPAHDPTGADGDAAHHAPDAAPESAPVQAPASAGDPAAPELVVVDGRAAGRDDLLASAGAGRQVLVISPESDPVAAISAALDGRAEVRSLRIVGAEGADGARLGNAPLTDAVLAGRAEEVMDWRDALAEGARIGITGADGTDGARLAGTLSDLTGAAAETMAAPATGRVLVVVDHRVEDAEALLRGLPPEAEVLRLGAGDDAVAAIGAALSRGGVDSLQILSHGSPGTLLLGDGSISLADLDGGALSSWRLGLSEDADILLLGCSVGAGAEGQAFLDRLAAATGADVAASEDATGAAALGGDWDLELRSGAIEAGVALDGAARDAYGHLLAAPNAGGDATVSILGGGTGVAEDSAPGAANIRLTVPGLSDPDGGTPTQIRIVSVTGGTIALGNGTAIAVGTKAGGGTAITLTGGAVDLRFTPAANATAASFQYVVVDAGADPDSAASTATVPITAVNDAPGNPTNAALDSIPEGTARTGNAGTAVSALVTRAGIADVDGDAPLGVAITGADSSNGTWEYTTDGGASWSDVGPRTDGTALLLLGDANTRVRFVPADSNYAGTPTLTFRSWDGTVGANGGTGDAGTFSATGAFGAAAATASLQVSDVNDSPQLVAAYEKLLPAILEDVADASNSGFQASTLLGMDAADDMVRDIDSGDSLGVAITATSGMAGTWQYRATAGDAWANVPAIPGGSAFLVSATALLRFVPASDQSGEASLSFRAWDGKAGTPLTVQALASLVPAGGESAVSTLGATAVLPVTAVNDDPVLGASSLGATEVAARSGLTLTAAHLSTTDIDNANPAQIVYRLEAIPADLVVTRRVGATDVEMAAGGTFTQKDVADGLIKVRFTGGELAGDASRQIQLTIRDGAGAVLGDGQPSLAEDPLRFLALTLTDVNAAVSIGSTTLSVQEYVAGVTPQVTVIDPGISDADAAALPAGRSVTFGPVANPALGTLEYSTDGVSWLAVSGSTTVTGAAAATLQLRFVQAANAPEPTGANASTTFSLSASDGRGSTDSKTVTIAISQVNDLPGQSASAVGFTVVEGASRSFNQGAVHLGISDADSDAAKAVYTLRSLPTKGALFLDGVRVGVGATFTQAQVDAGLLQYRHFGDEPNGDPGVPDDSFDYTLRDGDGGSTDSTFRIEVTPSDDPSVTSVGRLVLATGTWAYVTTSHVQVADGDTPAASVVITVTEPVPNGEFQTWDGAAWQTATSFTLAQVVAGNLVRFRHSGGDGDAGTYGGTLTVTDGTSTTEPRALPIVLVSTANAGGDGGATHGASVPVVSANAGLVVAEGSAGNVVGPALLTAQDQGTAAADLTYTVVTGPARGTLWLDDGDGVQEAGEDLAAGETFTQADIDANRLRYTHDGSETTADAFSFTVRDAGGPATATAAQTFAVTVTPVNDAPTIAGTVSTLAVKEHGTASDNVLSLAGVENAVLVTTDALQHGDVDPGTTAAQLIYVLTDAPDGGEIRVWSTAASRWVAVGTNGRFSAQQVADGHVAYFHNAGSEPDATGDRFTVVLTDGATDPVDRSEIRSAPRTISLAVENVNDAPTVQNGQFAVTEGQGIVLGTAQVRAADTDTDVSTLTYVVTQATESSTGRLWLDDGDGTYEAGEELVAGETFTHAELTGGRLRYTHLGNEIFADSFRFKVREPNPTNLESGEATVTVSVAPVFEDPVIQGDLAVQGYEGQSVTIGVADLGAIDAETYNPSDPSLTQQPELVQFRITSSVAQGRLVLDVGGVARPLGVGGFFTLDDVINGRLRYVHNGSENHADGFSVKVSDGSGGAEPTATVSIALTPVNDSPTLALPTGYVVNEDGTLALTGISVQDVDAGSGTIRVTLSVPAGSLTVRTDVGGGLGAAADGTGNGVWGSGTGTVTLTGTLAQVNATLAASNGVLFAMGADANGAATLTVTVSDRGNTGTDPSLIPGLLGGQASTTPDTGTGTDQQATGTAAITVRPVNDVPVLGGTPLSPTFVESGTGGTPVALLGGVSVSDVDITGNDFNGFRVTVELDAYRPGDRLTLDAAAAAGIAVTATGGSEAKLVLTFTGTTTAAQVAAALQAIRYANVGDDPTVKGTDADRAYTVTLDDMGNLGSGGARQATPLAGTIQITGETDSPTLGGSGRSLGSIPEDVADASNTGMLVSALLGSAGTLSDPDSANVGVAITAVADTNGTWQYKHDSGAWTAIAPALAGGTALLLDHDDRVRFVPNADYNGTATGGVTFRAWDQSSGTAGTSVVVAATGGTSGYSAATDTAGVTVTAVNDRPTLSGTAASPTATESGTGTNAVQLLTGTAVGDVDVAGEFNGFRITVALDAYRPGDLLSVDGPSTAGITFGVSGGSAAALVVTFTGTTTAAQVATVLEAIRFANTGEDPTVRGTDANRVFTVTLSDQGNVGSGGALNASTVLTGTITLVDENDRPVVSGAANLAGINEDDVSNGGSLVSSLVNVNNSRVDDAGVGVVIVSVTDTNGHYEYDNGGTWTRISTVVDGTNALRLTGADKVRFVPAADYFGSATGGITFRTWDMRDGSTRGTVLQTDVATGAASATGNYSAATHTSSIQVAPINDNPVIAGTGATPSYGEQTTEVAVGSGITALTDVDNTTATVTVTIGNYVAGDGLSFALGSTGITASHDGSGVYTLSKAGGAPLADMLAVIQSAAFSSTSDNPTVFGTKTTRTITFQANDGQAANNLSNTHVATVTFTEENDPPVVDATVGSTTWTEGNNATSTPVAVDSAVTVADPDDQNLTSARIRITTGYASGQDTLSFTNTATITGAWDAATGTLTLTGTDTVANYQAALRTIRFTTAGDSPSTADRTVEFEVRDAALWSLVDTKTLVVARTNDAPVVTATGGSAAYTENAAGVAVDAGLTLSDADDTQIAGATVRITAGLTTGDLLEFSAQNGISVQSWDAATGTLTLTGTATVAQYQAALRSVTFRSTSEDPTANATATARTVAFTVTDAGADGVGAATGSATRQVALTPLTDNPVVTTTGTALAYTEQAAATAIDPGLALADADDTQISGATVRITAGYTSGDVLAFSTMGGITGTWNAGTQTMTLSGTATVAQYQAALRTVTFRSTADDPTATSATRTITFSVTDANSDGAGAGSGSNTRTIDVTPVNDTPTLGGTAPAVTFTENGSAVLAFSTITVADTDDAQVAGATVLISSGYVAGDVLSFANTGTITGSWDAATRTLTLTGTDTVANYQAALRAVTFSHVGEDPTADATSTSRTIRFQVTDANSDGAGAQASTGIDATVTVAAARDNPVATATGGSVAYTENAAGVAVDPGLTLSDADDTQIAGATVQIAAGLSTGDLLEFSAQNGITVQSWNAGTGTLTLTGTATVAQYEAALRTVTFRSTSEDPTAAFATRTVTFTVTDANSDLTGAGTGSASRGVALTPLADAPVATATGGSAAYTENAAGVAVDAGLTLSDADDTQIAGATVQITAGLTAGDVLEFSTQNGITVQSWDAATGMLTLTGTATVAQYQAALRSVTFRSTSEDPTANATATARTVAFTVTDANSDGLGAQTGTATRQVAVTPLTDAPVVTTTGAALAYAEGGAAAAVDPGLALSDADDTQIAGATVRITAGLTAGDLLEFSAQSGITVQSWDAATGTLTLTGTATVAQYQAALRTVTFRSTGEDPTATSATRTVTFTVTDANSDLAGAGSGSGARTIAVTATADAPVVTATGGSAAYTENAAGVAVDAGLTLADADDTQIAGATVQITAGLTAGDLLEFSAQSGITVQSWDAATGTLTLTGTATVAQYQAALRTVTFRSTSEDPTANAAATARTVAFTVTDANSDGLGAQTGTATRQVAVTPLTDAPVVTTTGAALAYAEGGAAAAVDPGLTLSDADDTQIAGATVQITAGLTAGDLLEFSTQNGISVQSWDAGTGTLTLTGTATVAQYQAALRTVTFRSTGEDPTATSATRTVTFAVTDANSDLAGAGTGSAGRGIALTPLADAPVVTATGGSAAYTENAAGIVVDAGLTLSDADDSQIAGATVRITAGLTAGDLLEFSAQNGITVQSWDAATGTLTLTGTATVAQYQAALRTVTFRSTSEAPTATSATRTVTFTATDANSDGVGAASGSATRQVAVTPVNDAPALGGAAQSPTATESGSSTGAVALVSGAAVSDPDFAPAGDFAGGSLTVRLATGETYRAGDRFFIDTAAIPGFTTLAALGVQATSSDGEGRALVIQLDASATPANVATLLAALRYRHVGDDPDAKGTDPHRDFEIVLNDGQNTGTGTPLDSNVLSGRITVADQNDAPAPADDAATATEDGGALQTATGTVLANDQDADSTGLVVSALRTGPASGAGTAGTVGTALAGAHGSLTLRANGTYDYVLDNASAAVQGLRAGQTLTDAFTYTVSDGEGGQTTAQLVVTVQGTDDAPAVDLNGVAAGTGSTVLYTEVQQLDDGASVSLWPAAALSDVDSGQLGRIAIAVTGLRDGNAEILTLGGRDFALATDAAATVTAGGIQFQVSYAAATGAFAIAPQAGGGASLASFQALLRTAAYRNVSDTLTDGARTFSVVATDAGSDDAGTGTNQLPSLVATGTVTVNGINDAPIVDLNGAADGADRAVTYAEAANAAEPDLAIAPAGTLADLDNLNLSRLLLTVGGVSDGAAEFLTIGGVDFALGTDVTNRDIGAYLVTVGGPAGARTVDIRPDATPAAAAKGDLQALLSGIAYRNATDAPAGTRTIQVQATDAGTDDATGVSSAVSNVATVTIGFAPANDKPRLTGLSATVRENAANAGPVLLDGDVTLIDADSANFGGGQLTVAGLLPEDRVSLPSAPAAVEGAVRLVGAQVDAYTGGTWVRVGTASGGQGAPFVVDFEAAATRALVERVVESLEYRNLSDEPTASRVLSVTLDDGDAGGTLAAAGFPVVVVAENDAPTIGVQGLAANAAGLIEDATLRMDGQGGRPLVSVGDADDAGGPMTVTVSAAFGTLRVDAATRAALAFSAGTGAGDASMTFTGTKAAINAALATLTFDPGADRNGAAAITVRVLDNGNTGARSTTGIAAGSTSADPGAQDFAAATGAAAVSTRVFTLDVAPVNDAPRVVGGLPDRVLTEEETLGYAVAANLFNEVDANDGVTLSARLQGGAPLPSWLRFDPATRTFAAAPLRGDAGTVRVEVIGTDGSGASTSVYYTFLVNPAPQVVQPSAPPPADPPPVVVTPPPQPTNPGGLITVGGSNPDGMGPPLITGGNGQRDGQGGSGANDPGQRRTGDGNSLLSQNGLDGGGTNGRLELLLVGAPGNRVVIPETNATFQVPRTIFRHSNPGERLAFEAKRPDGQPLPGWLRFDPETLTFTGTPPASAQGNLDIVIVAQDTRGNQAAAPFRITVTRDAQDGGLQTQGAQPPAGTQGQGNPGQGNPGQGNQGQGNQGQGNQGEAPRNQEQGNQGEQGRGNEGQPGPRADGADPGSAAERLASLDAAPEPEGAPSLAAQIRLAGRAGLYAEGRALLDSLASAPEPGKPGPTGPEMSRAAA